MNDTDAAALGDGYTDDEEPGAFAQYLEDSDECSCIDPRLLDPDEPRADEHGVDEDCPHHGITARARRQHGRSAPMPIDPQDGTRDYDAERYEREHAPWETPAGVSASAWADAETNGAQGGPTTPPRDPRGGDHATRHDGPPRRMWPGHEDCGGIHHYDDEDGYVCRCGTVLGLHWPDTEEVERTVAEVQARPRADVDLRDPIRTTMQPLARDNITPAEVEGHLADILTRLETGLQYERWCADEYARLKLDADLAMARTIKDRRGGSQDVRRAEALIENEDLIRQRDMAESRWKAVRDTMHTVRSLQHGYQSILKSVRDTVSSPAQGRGGWYG